MPGGWVNKLYHGPAIGLLCTQRREKKTHGSHLPALGSELDLHSHATDKDDLVGIAQRRAHDNLKVRANLDRICQLESVERFHHAFVPPILRRPRPSAGDAEHFAATAKGFQNARPDGELVFHRRRVVSVVGIGQEEDPVLHDLLVEVQPDPRSASAPVSAVVRVPVVETVMSLQAIETGDPSELQNRSPHVVAEMAHAGGFRVAHALHAGGKVELPVPEQLFESDNRTRAGSENRIR